MASWVNDDTCSARPSPLGGDGPSTLRADPATAAGERVASEQLKVGRGEAGQRSVHTAGFVRPESLDEALALLAKERDGQIVSKSRWEGNRLL